MVLNGQENRLPGERRKSRRFKVKDGSFACLVSESRKVGEILDISAEGMALKFMESGQKHIPLTGTVELEIFNREGKFHLKRIPFKVSSKDSLKGPSSPFSLMTAIMKRLGGRFGHISPDQREQLGFFIEKFTVPA